MKKLVCASALLLAMSGAHAVDSIRWDSATLSYTTIEDVDTEYSGVALSASKKLTDNVFVVADYATMSDDEDGADADLDSLGLGVGYRTPLSNKTDVYGVASYVKYEVDEVDETTDTEGYTLETGVRTLVSPNIELGGSLQHINAQQLSETGVGVSAMYHLNDQFSAGLGYSTVGDIDEANVSLSVFF